MAKNKKPEATWLRDIEAIAAAMGLRLYDQRPKRLAQLAALRALTEAARFPAKDKAKGYWPREAVGAWLAERVEVAKGKREFTVKSEIRSQESGAKKAKLTDSEAQRKAVSQEPELPAQPNAPGELNLELMPEDIAAQKKRRLDYLQDIYLNPGQRLSPSGGSFLRLSAREEDELLRERPWLKAPESQEIQAENGNENIGSSLQSVANWIRNNFPGTVCNKVDISRWLHGEYLPAGCRENFPPPDEGNRYKASLTRAWVERYLVKPATGQNLPMVVDDRARKEKADADVAEMEAEELRRSLDKKWILREQALATGVAVVARLHKMVKAEDERNLPKLRRERLLALGVDAAVVAKFSEWDVEQAKALTDRREEAMAQAGKTI